MLVLLRVEDDGQKHLRHLSSSDDIVSGEAKADDVVFNCQMAKPGFLFSPQNTRLDCATKDVNLAFVESNFMKNLSLL